MQDARQADDRLGIQYSMIRLQQQQQQSQGIGHWHVDCLTPACHLVPHAIVCSVDCNTGHCRPTWKHGHPPARLTGRYQQLKAHEAYALDVGDCCTHYRLVFCSMSLTMMPPRPANGEDDVLLSLCDLLPDVTQCRCDIPYIHRACRKNPHAATNVGVCECKDTG